MNYLKTVVRICRQTYKLIKNKLIQCPINIEILRQYYVHLCAKITSLTSPGNGYAMGLLSAGNIVLI